MADNVAVPKPTAAEQAALAISQAFGRLQCPPPQSCEAEIVRNHWSALNKGRAILKCFGTQYAKSIEGQLNHPLFPFDSTKCPQTTSPIPAKDDCK